MKDAAYNIESLLYIIVKDGIVIKVSDAFCNFTGYMREEYMGKPAEAVFRGMLRMLPNYKSINGAAETYLFTKALEVRSVLIKAGDFKEVNEICYNFNVEPFSRIENKLGLTLKLLEDNIYGVGIFTAPELMLIKANEKYLDNLGAGLHRKEYSYGLCIKDMVKDFEGSEAEKLWLNILKNNQTAYLDKIKGISGSKPDKYWDNTIIPVTDKGRVIFLVSILVDVTALVQKENEIFRQQEQLNSIMANMSDGLMIVNENGEFDYINNTAKEAGFISKKYDERSAGVKYYNENGTEIKTDDLPANRVLQGKECDRILIRVVRHEKTSYYILSGQPLRDSQNRIKSALLYFSDVTEKYNYELSIKKQKEELESIIENISDSFFIIDSKGYYVAMNAAARKLYPELAIGKTINDAQSSFSYYDLDCNSIPYEYLPTRRALRGEHIKEEIVIMEHSGKEQIVKITATPIYDKENKLILVAAFFSDITEQRLNQELIKIEQERALQAEKEKSEALLKAIEMKNDYLSLISHEFKTPITVIDSAIQTMELLCKDTLPDKARKYIRKIKQNTYRQMRLVNNLLDISRMNAGYLRINKRNIDIVYLTKAIIDSVQLYAQQKDLKLTIESRMETKVMGIDDEKYERILLNLLSNAIKFTPEGKDITVKLSQRKHYISVEVKDTGVGIPEDKQTIIFDRFGQAETKLTRQAEGTGIGLSLVKLLTEAMDGSISVRSKEGEGSVFKVLLPLGRVPENECCISDARLEDSRLIQATAIEFCDIYIEN